MPPRLFRPAWPKSIIIPLVALLSASSLSAVDLDGFAIHGAASQTAAYSDRYDFLGSTASTLSLNITELTLNGAYRFDNGLRFTTQLYAYKLGDYRNLTLDLASLDYAFNEKIGVRLGRVKHPFGLYGESQDVDLIRPFVFLPLDFYNKSARPLNAAIDGASLYGSLPVGAGRVEYQLYGGWSAKLDPASPFIQSISDPSPAVFDRANLVQIHGVWICWETPLPGLRLGFSHAKISHAHFDGRAKTSREIALSPGDSRLLPGFLPPGYWDLLVAGQRTTTAIAEREWIVFVEYTHGPWQFAAEANHGDVPIVTTLPVIGTLAATSRLASYYAMATWQVAPKLQLGTYYGVAYDNRDDRDGHTLFSVPRHLNWLKDFAFASSYNLRPWWLLKAEAHLLDGTKGIFSAGNGDAALWRSHWTYFAVKTTVSF